MRRSEVVSVDIKASTYRTRKVNNDVTASTPRARVLAAPQQSRYKEVWRDRGGSVESAGAKVSPFSALSFPGVSIRNFVLQL